MMTRPAVSMETSRASITALIGAKRAFLVPMTVIFMVSYIGLTVLAGFAKGFMALKVIDLDAAFSLLTSEDVGSVMVGQDGTFNSQRNRIGTLAAAARLPWVSGYDFAEAGAVIGYGVDLRENFPRAAPVCPQHFARPPPRPHTA